MFASKKRENTKNDIRTISLLRRVNGPGQAPSGWMFNDNEEIRNRAEYLTLFRGHSILYISFDIFRETRID